MLSSFTGSFKFGRRPEIVSGGGGVSGTTYTAAGGDWTNGFFYLEGTQNQMSLNTGLADAGFVSALESTPSGTQFSITYDPTDASLTETVTQTGASSYFGSQLNIPVSGQTIGNNTYKIISITF